MGKSTIQSSNLMQKLTLWEEKMISFPYLVANNWSCARQTAKKRCDAISESGDADIDNCHIGNEDIRTTVNDIGGEDIDLLILLLYYAKVTNPISWGCRICWLHHCKGVKHSPKQSQLLAVEGNSMFEGRILIAEQSLTRQPNWSSDEQHSTLALTELDGWLERPDPINWLVISSHSTDMIVKTIFFKLLLCLTSSQPYVTLMILEDSDWGSIMLRW